MPYNVLAMVESVMPSFMRTCETSYDSFDQEKDWICVTHGSVASRSKLPSSRDNGRRFVVDGRYASAVSQTSSENVRVDYHGTSSPKQWSAM